MRGYCSLKEQGYRRVNLEFAQKYVTSGIMDYPNDDLMPPARLAVSYAPPTLRSALALLLLFDARLAAIVANAKEPLIGQMKLAWWRDALLAEPANRPTGEPYLASLTSMNDPALAAATLALVDAWEMLVVEGDWLEPIIEQFAATRSAAIFETYAQMADLKDDVQSLGRQWAIDDLYVRFGQRAALDTPTGSLLPRSRQFRPLTILAMSVRGNSGPRLVWHALTGR
jgi:15-cis-phytoene synthase